MAEPKKTPLQEEKDQKAQEILDKNPPPGKEDEKAPYGYFANGKPRKTPPGSTKKKTAKQTEPEFEFNPDESRKQGEFFICMMESLRRGMGITKPIPEASRETFISSIPAMEMKYGAAVSKYMPEMMFFGSSAMIIVDTIKELKVLKLAELEAQETGAKPATKKSPENDPPKQN